MAEKETDLFSKEFVTADGNSFANKNHLQNVADAGQALVMNTRICLKDEGKEAGKFKVIGGINNFNFNVNNNIIPLAEMGSDKWLMLIGKTAPANISISRYFVHCENILKIMSEGATENLELSDQEMILDLTSKYLKVSRDYYLIINWTKVVDGDEVVIRTEVKKIRGLQLNSFNMSFGSGIVVMEQCSGMCQGITDYLEQQN